MPNTVVVKNVIGISTNVKAKASTKGWYKAAFSCLRTMGRWAYRAGISAMVVKAENRRALCKSDNQNRKYKQKKISNLQKEDTATREVSTGGFRSVQENTTHN